MISRLLSKIARRGAASNADALRQAPISILAGGNHGSSYPGLQLAASNSAPPASSAGAQDPFNTIFPAPQRLRSARTGLTQSDGGNAWLLACDNYLDERMKGAAIADQPAFFANWTPAHMAVAQMLWAERERLHQGEIHIHSGDDLLAVLQPARLQVKLRAAAYQAQEALALRQMPVQSGATSFANLSADFELYSLYSLLWFYGQVYSAAPDLLPPAVGTQLIQLRRFPAVEPAALEMRHLALIHVFSGGALSFAQLQRQVLPEHAPYLCPDLASLYFTGALRLLP